MEIAALLASTGFSAPSIEPCLGFTLGLEQNAGDRTVHGLRHEQGQQRSGCAHDHARDHQRRILQHEPFKSDRQPGGRIADGEDDRHIGAADRQCDQDAQEERAAEEDADQAGQR
jgi:hypothetical protein